MSCYVDNYLLTPLPPVKTEENISNTAIRHLNNALHKLEMERDWYKSELLKQKLAITEKPQLSSIDIKPRQLALPIEV